jgi:hypothetical protein
MPGYTTLWGDASTTQSALVIPQPGNDSIYYIFTGAAEVSFGRRRFTGISYSTVNMRLSAGNGAVVTSNDTLLPYACEKICGIRNQNGTDYWVIVHKFASDQFYVYPVTAAGIGAPIIESIGRYYFHGTNPSNTIGYLKASKDGRHLAAVVDKVHNDTIDLFSFDACSGLLSDYKPIPYAGDGYGVCFSPSGQFLYVSSESIGLPDDLWQFDITAPDILASMVTLHHSDSLINLGAIQEGPDGKLYIAEAPRNYLGVISNPDLPGLSCNFSYSGCSLGAHTSAFGLPNFIEGFGASVVTVLHDSIFTCLRPYVLSVNPSAASYRWSTGDSVSAIAVSSSGSYWVSRSNACSGASVDSFYIHFIDSVEPPDIPDTILCTGTALAYEIDRTLYTAATWNGTVSAYTYPVTNPGNYFVVVNSSCGDFIDSFEVIYQNIPRTTPIADTIICEGASVQYNFADTGFSSVQWNGTFSGISFNSSDTGMFFLSATSTCGIYADTFHISYKVFKHEALPDTTVCKKLPVEYSFLGAGFSNITWNATTMGNFYSVTDSGMQFLSAESPCGMYTDTFFVSYVSCEVDTPELKIPTAFSPNGDGNNDYFTVFGSNVNSYHISVYNRWGQLVYESANLGELNNLNSGWDGTFAGMPQPADVYTYNVSYSNNIGLLSSKRGNVSLIK